MLRKLRKYSEIWYEKKYCEIVDKKMLSANPAAVEAHLARPLGI